MKRLLVIYLGCLAVIAPALAHQYVPSSLLANGRVVKMSVSETGIYRLTYEEIVSLGLNPDKVGVLGYGGNILNRDFTQPKIDDAPAVSIYIHRGNDGVFNNGDYILFYACGTVGWNYNGTYFSHTRNTCSNVGYYFLSDADGARKEMPMGQFLSETNTIRVTNYARLQLYEQELVNLIDVTGKEGGGKNFYGEKIATGGSLSKTFSFPNAVDTIPLTCRVAVASVSDSYTEVAVRVGNETNTFGVTSIPSGDFYTRAVPSEKIYSNYPASTNPNVVITYSGGGSASALYIDYVECVAYCQLKMTGDALFFRNPNQAENRKNSLFAIQNADSETQIWNITRKDSIYQMPTSWHGDTLCFVAGNKEVEEFVAVRTNGTQWLQPQIEGTIANQNLHHDLKDVDMLIITPEAFLDEAYDLANAHWQVDSLNVSVVTDTEVYNEFSSGTPDPSAYRWVMKMLYDRAQNQEGKAPSYLLLMGDGTYDNRKLMATSGTPTLLTYQADNSTRETEAYATDDYFAYLHDNDGVVGASFYDQYGSMEIGVGRLPVNTKEEAQTVVNKIIRYMLGENTGQWRQQICFLADDGDHNQHTQISDEAAEKVRIKNPDFIVNKIYLDAFQQIKTASMESYPAAYNKYMNLLNKGVLLMDYSGHGGSGNICSEQFLTLKSVKQLQNKNLGFWMLATCNFAHFDMGEQTAAEAAVLNADGGAIGVMSACRTVYASENRILNRNLCDTLFAHTTPYRYTTTLGQATMAAKNHSGKSKNKLSYILLADPAVRLHYPTQYQVAPLSTADTLKALSLVNLAGFIQNENGDTVTDFQGLVHFSVYDKMQVITTLDNDEQSEEAKQPYSYFDYPNLLFASSAEVKNGQFTMSFRMPQDIHYNYGNGRIVYYALSNDGEEAVGHSHNVIIGGSDPKGLLLRDTIGPDIQLYLDHPKFVSGGETSEKPHLFVNLYDENGINTVGSGIGHDLMMVIDDDPQQTYMLNDYYVAKAGSYQAGNISFPMAELAEGNHSLFFRAWDLLNNSSIETLQFTVVKGLGPQLYSVSVAPNPCPAAEQVTLYIEADRPDEILQTEMHIFSINGMHVTSFSWKDDRTYQFSPTDEHMAPGVYIFRIECLTSTSGASTAVGKLIVL